MRIWEWVEGQSSEASKGSSGEGVEEEEASAEASAVVEVGVREERRSGMIPFGGGGGPSGRGGSMG